jgi:hypothetical protein
MFLATHGIIRNNSGGGSFLLDTYSGASAGYSLRKLSSTYSGSCIRVRRSSDNAEQDFGFVSNALDTASLLTFVGAGNGFVTTWYDQSGLGRNAIQTTASNQPIIATSGVVNTLNGKNTIRFNLANSQFLFVNSTTVLNIQDCLSTFSVMSFVNTGGFFGTIMSKGYGAEGAYFIFQPASQNNFGVGIESQPYFQTATDKNRNEQYLFSNTNATGTNGIKLYKNNSIFGEFTTTENLNGSNIYKFNIGRNDRDAGSYIDGNIQEIICYPINQNANLTNINTNINTYYSIY